MTSTSASGLRFDHLTVYRARRIRTMTDAQPTAEAVAVANGRIVAVGTLESLQPWLTRFPHSIDDTFADDVLFPGLIDPHVHPSLPAVTTQFPFLAPDDWTLPSGAFPGAPTPDSYLARLKELYSQHSDWSVPFIVWGFHPLWHGDQYRPQLDALFPDRPVLLWHRSFHELILNTPALAWFGLREEEVRGRPECDWDRGHFWENGAQPLVVKLAPIIFDPVRYGAGMSSFFRLCQQAGVTTVLDMGIGIFGDAVGEIGLIREVAESHQVPCRAILTPTTVDFLARGIRPADALAQVEEWSRGNSRRVFLDRHFKLQVDGAIYGGLSQVGFPGYIDGHAGMWMAPPEVLREFAEVFWRAGHQLHAHINGDLSADLYLDILRSLQEQKPRFGHRTTLEHFASTSEDQCRQMRELGMVVSANPYYHYILADVFSEQWLGNDRGSEMGRLGTLEKLGIPFALHSDCPMAPLSPLTLAWAAANRVTINGHLRCLEERVSLHAALRAITIDAAWILRKEREIGSIRAGKLADFAVLAEDPYDVGAEALRDITVKGVVFEGEAHPL
ncbi:MAG: amidohydrolase [Cyanobacteriota bacterium]